MHQFGTHIITDTINTRVHSTFPTFVLVAIVLLKGLAQYDREMTQNTFNWMREKKEFKMGHFIEVSERT